MKTSYAQLNATRQRIAGEEIAFEITPGVELVACWIPPGDFLMGSPEDDIYRSPNETQHRVRITRGFWLAKTPTTQAQWQAVMGDNPSHFKGRALPVEQVNWNDICRTESGTGGFLGMLNTLLPGGGHFYLPTEAQWEFAFRAGSPESHTECTDEIAWHQCNSNGKTHPVGQKKANAWGLHDMLGNVQEWCADWYGYFYVDTVEDPIGPVMNRGNETRRVVRSSSWSHRLYYTTESYARRSCENPSIRSPLIGFRVACNPPS